MNQPIRVLHMISSLDIGGSQTMVVNLYRAINKKKIQFDFIVDHPEEVVLKETIEKMGGVVYFFPTFNGKNVMEIINVWNLFFQQHPEYRILHTHSRSYASIYLPIAKKHGVITIAHSHSASNGKGVIAWVKNIMQIPIRYQADYLFACADDAGKWLYGKNVTKKKNYRMIPNGINIEEYAFSEEKRKNIRDALNIDNNLVIGHIGRFHEAKNHLFLLRVFYEIHKQNNNAKLILVGDGNLRDTIEEEIDRLKIRNSVIITGMVNDPRPYYSAIDIFLFPSIWEGLPVSVVEAQAAGLPCIISSNITKQVCISELVHQISIDEEPKIWAKAILSVDVNRTNVSNQIKKSGFDIVSTAKWFEDFYITNWNCK